MFSFLKSPLGFYYNIIHANQMWLSAKVLIGSLLKAKFIWTIRQTVSLLWLHQIRLIIYTCGPLLQNVTTPLNVFLVNY